VPRVVVPRPSQVQWVRCCAAVGPFWSGQVGAGSLPAGKHPVTCLTPILSQVDAAPSPPSITQMSPRSHLLAAIVAHKVLRFNRKVYGRGLPKMSAPAVLFYHDSAMAVG